MNALVVDDHPVYRDGILRILNSLPDIEYCDEAGNGQAALDKMIDHHYHVVFLDINMPVMDGILTTERIKKDYPDTIIIILTMFDSRKQIVELIEMGVHGYVLKSTDREEIIHALMLVSEGRQYFTKEVYDIWAQHLVEKSSQHTYMHREPQLSDREIEIVKLFCQQLSAKQIANKLFVSESTINTHRSRIMKKIGVDNVVGLVIYAIKNKIYIP